jgi:uncharacterized protein YegP (UPF0339 family)
MPGTFELTKNSGGEFIFRLKASNRENILRSEGYSSKSGAQNGIESVKKNAADAANFVKLTAKNGQFYFNLRAANHQVIGTSEMYSTESARDNGIQSVQKHAPEAQIVDMTAA